MKERLPKIILIIVVVLYGLYALNQCIAISECRKVNAVEDCPGGDPPGF